MSQDFCNRGYVQLLSLTLLNDIGINSGDIICECVDQSISRVIGILSIMMSGGIYCPFSLQELEYHLDLLLQQNKCRLILIDCLTQTKFNNDIILFDINSILTNRDIDIERFSNVVVTTKNIAYITFTSGSNGVPKLVSSFDLNKTFHMYYFIDSSPHCNFIRSIPSLSFMNIFTPGDTIVQMANSSNYIYIYKKFLDVSFWMNSYKL